MPRLQKLLGHASPVMTMRYTKHTPESYFAEGAARVAASLQGGLGDAESGVRAELNRGAFKLA